VSVRRPPAPAPEPFTDEVSYVEAQLARLQIVLERAVAVAAGKSDEAAQLSARATELRQSIAARAAAAEAAGVTLGVEALRRRFSLDEQDVDIILHTAAATIDPHLGKLHTRLSGIPFHPWLDVGIVLQVYYDTVADRLRARARFQPSAPLILHRLITLDRGRPDARENLLACELKLPPRVARLVLGTDPTGGASTVSRLVEPDVTLDHIVLPDDARTELEQVLAAQPTLERRLADWGYDVLMPSGRATVLLFTGPPGTGKTTLATALARHLGKRLLVVDGPRLLEAGRGLEAEVDELLLEARLQDAVLLFDECELLFGGRAGASTNTRIGTLLRALDRFDGMVVLATNLPDRLDSALDRRVLLRIQLDVPAPALREKIWRQLLPPTVPLAPDVDIPQLAKRYDFSGGYIKSAVLFAVSKAVARGGGTALQMRDLDAAAQAQLRGDLSYYAERTRGTALSLDVLVLPPDEKSQIEEIIAAGRNRSRVLYGWGFNERLPTGKGLVCMFVGDPGTGKTLAAEVVAAELGMHLFRVNPAKVVSKYVGETEKNLNEILAQAKSTHAILFFDEADALFSTRVTKVESANDRFVNMETNFLLQQLERFEGIVILATNLETTIDQAFKRRIAYWVNIPFPKPPDRERIWRTLIPSRAPVADIDYARLGRTFELSGGHIKNAILRAAYSAAQNGVPLDTDLLADAAEKECWSAGKLFQNMDAPKLPSMDAPKPAVVETTLPSEPETKS
jgi:SpoVK/Ycf46/Vps4 family AAA+-type ATPase